MKTETTTIKNAITSLTKAHRANWMAWYSKLEKVIPILNGRTCDSNGDDFGPEDDLTAVVTDADFTSAGYSADEASALVFVLTEDCMGEAVNSLAMIDRWFTYCAAEVR